MKKSTQIVLLGILFLNTIMASAQISTRTDGAVNVLANSPTTNTNVGIGTNTPKSKLDVKGGLTVGSTYAGVNAAPTNGAIIEGNVGIGTTNPSAKLEVVGDVKATRLELINSLPDGTTFLDWKDRNKRCAVINAGTLRDPQDNGRNFWFLDWPQSNLNPKSVVIFGIDDRSNKTRFSVWGE